MERDRNDHGRYSDRIPPDTVLEAFEAREDRARPLTAGDVVDDLGIARRTAHNKLNALVERGVLETRKVGARGRVWWIPIPADDREPTAPRDAPQRDEAPTPSDRPPEPDVAGERAETTGLEAVTFPGGRPRDDCEAAVLAARDYLREHGPATMREIVAEVMPEHPLEYDVDGALEKVEGGERYRGAWWRRVVKPGLKALEDVDAPARGESDWRYTGEK